MFFIQSPRLNTKGHEGFSRRNTKQKKP